MGRKRFIGVLGSGVMWFARRLAGSENVWVVLVMGKSLIGFSLLSFRGFHFFFGSKRV